MEFLVLGPLEVLDGGRPVPLGSAKQRILLAALLASANVVVSADRLADIVWGDDLPGNAVATLQTYVSRLRATLEPDRVAGGGPEMLLTRPPGYLLHVNQEQVDAARFERFVTEAQQRVVAQDPAGAAALLDEALGLWRGQAFAEFVDLDFARAECVRLEELRLVALEERADANLALGHHTEVIGDLEAMVTEHPLRERPRAQFMLALYRAGREVEALKAFQEYRRYLGDELGIEPSVSLRRLEEEILRQEPHLEQPPPRGSPPASTAVPPGGQHRDQPRGRASIVARVPRGHEATRSGIRDEPALSRMGLGPPTFVGRHRELEFLLQHLDDAARGQPRIVFVSGDVGVGKSWLVRQLQQTAVGRGFAVCSGRCREQIDLPYLPFIGSLFSRLEKFTVDDPAPVGDFLGPLLGRTPNDAALGPGQPDETRPEHEKAMLLRAVSKATIRLAQDQPMLLAVDDLHWADRPSLDMLCNLVFDAADASLEERVPLFIAVTHRPVLDPGVAHEVARLNREEICETIELTGLDESESHELVRALGLERASRQLIEKVHETTSGNPLFIESVVRQLIRSGLVHERSGALVTELTSAELAIPDELADAITERIDELSDRSKSVLTVAAFLGDAFSLEDLAATSGESESDLVETLEDAMHAGILVGDSRLFQFAHSLFTRVLRAGLSTAARQQIHRTIARALAASSPEGDDLRRLEIAYHLTEAGPAIEPAELLQHARAAADQAWAMSAWADAARYYDAAAAASPHAGRPESADLAGLLYRAGVAHYRNMDPGPSRARFEQAVEAYESAGDLRGLAVALMERARVELTSGGFGNVVDVSALEHVLAQLGEAEPSLCARILAQLADTYWVQGQLDVGEGLATRALDLGRRVSDHVACVRAQCSLAIVRWIRLDLRDALESLEDAQVHARAEGDPWLEGLVLPRLALTLLWLGRLEDAHAAALGACETARVTRDAAEHSLALAALVGVAVARGDFPTAERYGHDALSALRMSSYAWSRAFLAPALVSGRLLQGTWDEAASAVDLWVDPDQPAEFSELVEDGAWLARQLVRAHAGDATGLRPALAARPERTAATWPVWLGAVQRFAALAEIADQAGVDVPLEEIERALAHAAAKGMLITDGLIFLVPRLRGVVAGLQRRWVDAEQHLEEALATASRIGARPEFGRTCLDYARLLLARSSEGDRERASQLALRAAAVFGELGMDHFEHEAAGLTTSLTPEHANRPATRPSPVASDVDQGTLAHSTEVIAFVDITESTALTERLGDLAFHAKSRPLDVALRAAVTECGGNVAGEGGDGLLALFPSARRAIEWARRAHACAQAVGLQVHLGIHAGDIIHSEGNVYGGAVNIAARLCTEAGPGETLVSETVRSLARTSADVVFEDRGIRRLKGVTEPERVFAVAIPPID